MSELRKIIVERRKADRVIRFRSKSDRWTTLILIMLTLALFYILNSDFDEREKNPEKSERAT